MLIKFYFHFSKRIKIILQLYAAIFSYMKATKFEFLLVNYVENVEYFASKF